MQKFKCNACGYVYDPRLGDEKGRIPPDTAFEDLPAEWRCPQCGAKPTQFRRDEPKCLT